VPIDVWAMSRVNGMIATIKMMNGTERVALTMAPNTSATGRFGVIPPLSVATSSTPSGTPSSSATSDETLTICSVSHSASGKRDSPSSHIA
jgi:hypothetical protein